MKKIEIVENKIEKRQVAYISYKGSYDEVPVLMGEVVGFIMAKGLQMMGAPFGVYFNSPHEVPVEELLYDEGMPFAGEAKEEGRVKIKTTPEQPVLSTNYKGPYGRAGNAIGALAEYASKNGYEIIGHPLETYISDPNETPESELVTEICFPVMKK